MIEYKQTKQGHFAYEVEDKKSNMKRFELSILFVWIAALFAAFFNSWDGDPSIYFVYAKNIINGHGLVFNLAMPSASYSSPLWLLIVVSCLANPFFVKIVSVIILAAGAYLIYEQKGLVTSALIVYLSCVPVFHGYETVLIVLGAGLMFRNAGAGFIIITLARPEALILYPILSLSFNIKLKYLLPSLIYYALIYLYVGIPASFIARSTDGFHWFGMRYVLLFIPVMVLYADSFINTVGWRKYVFTIVLIGLSVLKIPKDPLTFEQVTYKEVAQSLQPGSVLYTTEIQTRFWNDSLFCVSSDGLLYDYKTPTHYLKTYNDKKEIGKLISKTNYSTIDGLYLIK